MRSWLMVQLLCAWLVAVCASDTPEPLKTSDNASSNSGDAALKATFLFGDVDRDRDGVLGEAELASVCDCVFFICYLN